MQALHPKSAFFGIWQPLPYWPLWLAVCLLSRTLTSLHYLADPDSLRFALGVLNFDLAKLQPHFPGYPVFCFLVKGLCLVIGKFSYAFALMGGLATFLLLLAGSALFRQIAPKATGWPFLLLLFLNPMIWLLSNRYMPDLLGAALGLVCLSLYQPAFGGNQRAILLFFLLAGVLAGVRLSYLPFVFLPAGVLLLRPSWWQAVLAGSIGVLVWLVPMVLDTGMNTLVAVAGSHTEGHFTEWGGTVLSEPSHAQRLLRTFQFAWAHGLGGYWVDRNWLTAVFSALLVTAALLALPGISKRKAKTLDTGRPGKSRLVLVLLCSALLYLLWIYFYQNVVHQSRHVLPLLPILLLLPGLGLATTLANRPKTGIALLVLVFACNAWLTSVLVTQQRSPTAVFQVKEYLAQHGQPGQVVVSLEMINYFLEQQGIQAGFISADGDSRQLNNAITQGKTVWVVGSFSHLPKRRPEPIRTFYHNPYVNSLWPEISLYCLNP